MAAIPAGLDARHLEGPFAVIGDVHGCVHTLDALLRQLGGSLTEPVPGLTLVSVGDLHDKAGPAEGPLAGEPGSVEVLRWAVREKQAGRLVLVDSNHGLMLAKYLRGERRVRPLPKGSAERTAFELSMTADASELSSQVLDLVGTAPVFARFSGGPTGEFIVAHAAASERLLTARHVSDQERSFLIRATDFRWTGSQTVVVGHMGVPAPQVTRERRADGSFAGPVVRIDTGVDDGGALTAYLPHENRFVSVPRDPRDTRSWSFSEEYPELAAALA